METKSHSRIIDAQIETIFMELPTIKGETIAIQKYCERIELSIDRFIDKSDKIISRIYHDMDAHRDEFKADIAKVNVRIDNLQVNLYERLENSESKILSKLDNLQTQIGKSELNDHNDSSKKVLELLNEWKWKGLFIVGTLWFVLYQFNVFSSIHNLIS